MSAANPEGDKTAKQRELPLTDLPIQDGARIRLNSSFSRGPLIPARPQRKPVTFYGNTGIPQKDIVIRVGAVAKNQANDDDGDLCPSLHIELWHLILVLFTFWKERPDFRSPIISPSFGAVWRRFTCSNARPSPNQLASFGRLVTELNHLVMAVKVDGRNEELAEVITSTTERRLLNFGNVELLFKHFEFDIRFVGCLLFAPRSQSQDVRLDVLAGITSRYVRAAYLWLPARASHHEHEAPAKDTEKQIPEYLGEMAVLSSADFFRNLGEVSVPRWKRRHMLTNHGEHSILRQLHGLPLMRQYMRLGVAWWDSEDDFYIGTYCYHADDWVPGATVGNWRERGDAPAATGSLYANFVAGGGTPKAYFHMLRRWKSVVIEPYVLERMTKLRVQKIDEYMPLYKQAVSILGPDVFRDLVGNLGEAAARKEDAGFLFRGILFEKVRQLAQARTAQCEKAR